MPDETPTINDKHTARLAFYKDLLKAQRAMDNITKDATNPAFKSTKGAVKYATLEAVLDVIRPALNENNITLLQPSSFSRTDDGLHTTLHTVTYLVHADGHVETFDADMAVKSNPSPQEQGSAISYNRRYSLMSIFSLATEDDDGNSASGKKAPSPTQSEADKLKVWENALKGAKTKTALDSFRKKVVTAGFSPESLAKLEATATEIERGMVKE